MMAALIVGLAALASPSDGDAVYFSLEFRGRELGIVPAWIVNGSDPDPLFEFGAFAATLGIPLRHDSGSMLFEGELLLEVPTDFALDLGRGLGRRGDERFTVAAEDWRLLDGTLHLRAPLLARLTGVALDVRPAALALVVRSPERSVPALAARGMRRAAGTPRDGDEDAGTTWARTPDRRLGDLIPRALYVVHSTSASTTGGAAAGTLRFGTSLLQGGLELQTGWSRSADPRTPVSSQLRWSWTLGRPGSRWLEHVRVGWGAPAGPGQAADAFGVRIGNGPLRRPPTVGSFSRSGVTEPGAEVQLLVAGRLVEAVVADAEGNWSVELPVASGENRAELVFLRSDGIHREPLLALADPEMIPAGRFEYALSYDRRHDAMHGDLRWGLHPRATVRAGLRHGEAGLGASHWVGLAWAPHDRVALRLDALGSIQSVQARLRPWSVVELDVTHREAASDVAQAATGRPMPMGGTGVGTGVRRMSQLRLRTRAMGPLALALEVGSQQRMRTTRQSAAGRLDLRTHRWMGTFQVEGARTLDPAGAAGPWRSRERVGVVLSGLPGWMQTSAHVRLSAEVLSRDLGAHIDGVSARIALPRLRVGQLEASVAWMGGRAPRFALALQTATSFARITQSATRTPDAPDGWSASTSASGTLSVSSEGVAFSRDLATAPGALRLEAWVDDDGDGRRDPDEPALPDAVVDVLGTRRRLESGGTLVRNLPTLVPLRIAVDDALPTWDPRGIEVVPVTPIQWVSLAPFAEGRLELAFAPAGVLTGQVRDASAREPNGIGGTLVELASADARIERRAVASADGHFEFRGLPPGRYRVRIHPSSLEALGAHVPDHEVQVDANGARLILELAPAPASPGGI